MPRYVYHPHHSDIPSTADVVIIGGGPAGAAALWALHELDPALKVVLIERADQLASGSSTASLENFRTCWPTACIAHQCAESIHVYLHADEFIGEGAKQAIQPKVRGYLFCGFNSTQAEQLRADVEHLHTAGLIHIEYHETPALHERFPWLDRSVIAAKYDPQAGWLDSYGLVSAYAKAAEHALVLLGVEGVTICHSGGRIVGVQWARGQIQTERVILANGAGAVVTASLSGLSLPVVLRPRQSFTTDFRHEPFPADAPMLISAVPHPHVRPEAGSSAIFGWEYQWYSGQHDTNGRPLDALTEPHPNLSALKDPRFPSITLALLARHFGHTATGFADGRYLRGIRHNIGYYVYRDATAAYTVAPDGTHTPYTSERAILDQHPDVQGLFLSVAHSGHGIMTSAAAGRIVARHTLGMTLHDPLYEQFRISAHWVEHDENAL
ncbi:MAG: FAD-binding oxidoreductase [Anaerolineae bacterium]